MKLNTLVPGFLKKIDDRLLRNHPTTWSSRIHHVLFFSSVIIAVFFLLLLFVNRDPREESSQYTWMLLMVILIIIAIVTYLIFLFRFNVLKRFGEWTARDSLFSFLFYFITFFMIYFWAFIPSVTESIMANRKYSAKEISVDQNEYNKSIILLEKDSLDLGVYRADSAFLINEPALYSKTERVGDYARCIYDVDNHMDYAEVEKKDDTIHDQRHYLDSISYFRHKEQADSVQMIGKDAFVVYNIPKFNFCNSYNRYDDEYERNKGKWTTLEMYHEVMKELKNPDPVKYKTTIKRLQSKYLFDYDTEYPVGNYTNFRINRRSDNAPATFEDYAGQKYFCSKMETRMENIIDRKKQWNDDDAGLKMRILFYLTLISSIFLWLFRHNTKKSFFLSFLIAGLLFLFTSIFMILVRVDEPGIYSTLLFYYVIFLLMGIGISGLKTQRLFPAIAANFVVLTTYFLPMYIVLVYYYIQRKSNGFKYVEYEMINRKQMVNLNRAEYAGFILLLIMIYFLFSKLYKKWIALPEE